MAMIYKCSTLCYYIMHILFQLEKNITYVGVLRYNHIYCIPQSR